MISWLRRRPIPIPDPQSEAFSAAECPKAGKLICQIHLVLAGHGDELDKPLHCLILRHLEMPLHTMGVAVEKLGVYILHLKRLLKTNF